MGQAVGACCNLCNFDDVLIETVLGWLTPLQQNFGPFGVSLDTASHDDDNNDSHINLKEFSLQGVNLHGKITADIPLFGTKELPINLGMGVEKALQSKACSVNVGDIDFNDNEHATDPDANSTTDRGIGDMFSGMASAASGGIKSAFHSIFNPAPVKEWVCREITDIINQKLMEKLGVDSDSDEG